MTTTSTRVEDAKLRGMLTSCEGVTPGPWSRHDSLQETSVLSEVHSNASTVVVVPWGRGGLSLHNNAHRDAEFIANCDPDTIRSILSELLDLREAVSTILPYLRWTISDESPGHHPTMPSAVAVVEAAARSLSQGAGHEQ